MKKKFKEILQSYGIEINENDSVDILYSTAEIFEHAAKETKEKYPYATNIISDYETAARVMRDLAYEIERE